MYKKGFAVSNLNFTDTPAPAVGGGEIKDNHLLKCVHRGLKPTHSFALPTPPGFGGAERTMPAPVPQPHRAGSCQANPPLPSQQH